MSLQLGRFFRLLLLPPRDLQIVKPLLLLVLLRDLGAPLLQSAFFLKKVKMLSMLLHRHTGPPVSFFSPAFFIASPLDCAVVSPTFRAYEIQICHHYVQ